MKPVEPLGMPEEFTTFEVARLLGMSVRSVQLMVDRGELQAWKTTGGHRRISRASVEQWRASRHRAPASAAETPPQASARPPTPHDGPASPQRPCVLLIDDSVHFQKLVTLLVRQGFPEVDLQVADDGISGLALYGKLQPQVLLVDILLPGIDGAALITSLRSHKQFARSHLGVVTSLDESQRQPYAFALERVPVIHKPRLVVELPRLLAKWLRGTRAARAASAGAASA